MMGTQSHETEKRNKHTKKNCAPRWLYSQDYTGMHGQQNIKYIINPILLIYFKHNGMCSTKKKILGAYFVMLSVMNTIWH